MEKIIQGVVFLVVCMLGLYGVLTFIRTTNFILCLLLASIVVSVSYASSIVILEILED